DDLFLSDLIFGLRLTWTGTHLLLEWVQHHLHFLSQSPLEIHMDIHITILKLLLYLQRH
ncbi:hypothetical protein B0F90DRAFT_1797393, partial [Multifurca ochricompacta]